MSVGLFRRSHVQHLFPRHGFVHSPLDDAVVSRRSSLSVDQTFAACAGVRSERAIFLLLNAFSAGRGVGS